MGIIVVVGSGDAVEATGDSVTSRTTGGGLSGERGAACIHRVRMRMRVGAGGSRARVHAQH